MKFSTVSPYLENIIIQKNENDGGLSVSGGIPLKMFSEHHIGGSSMDRSVDGINKIGGLSVPIGLVLSPENDKRINVKYSNNDNIKKKFSGGSLGVINEDKSIYENAILGGSLSVIHEEEYNEGGSAQKTDDEIEHMNDIEMKNLLDVVCNLREKQNTRKKK
jgi:hypothetical protein